MELVNLIKLKLIWENTYFSIWKKSDVYKTLSAPKWELFMLKNFPQNILWTQLKKLEF